MNLPEPDTDARSDEAWRLAREIVGALSPPEWPMDSNAESVAYLYGLLFCAITLEAVFDPNGVQFRFPPLAELGIVRERLVSYEAMLPTDRRWLAERLRGLAAIVTRQS